MTYVLRQRVDVENNINIYGYAMHLLGTVVSLVTFVLGCQTCRVMWRNSSCSPLILA